MKDEDEWSEARESDTEKKMKVDSRKSSCEFTINTCLIQDSNPPLHQSHDGNLEPKNGWVATSLSPRRDSDSIGLGRAETLAVFLSSQEI